MQVTSMEVVDCRMRTVSDLNALQLIVATLLGRQREIRADRIHLCRMGGICLCEASLSKPLVLRRTFRSLRSCIGST